MFPLERHTLFLTLAGSQAHGTARDGSDLDIRGVCVAPLPVRLSLFRAFEQYEGPLPDALEESVLPRLSEHPTAAGAMDVKTECVIFDLAKFVGLCCAANPNALEILFADERDWLIETHAWRRLHAMRHRFLTRQVQQTFSGYALAQLKKIKAHRSWLLNPPANKPLREEFGLASSRGTLSRDDQNRIEQGIAEKLRSYGIDTIEMPRPTRVAVQERIDAFQRDLLAFTDEEHREQLRAVATQALDLPLNVVSALDAERKYRAALKHWESYQSWQLHRNPARAELERKHGYDTKHAMHLIRMMRMGLEVLQHGELRVRRDDAAELLAIRDGALVFEDLLAQATTLQSAMADAATRTTLPANIERDEVDLLLTDLLLQASRPT